MLLAPLPLWGAGARAVRLGVCVQHAQRQRPAGRGWGRGYAHATTTRSDVVLVGRIDVGQVVLEVVAGDTFEHTRHDIP